MPRDKAGPPPAGRERPTLLAVFLVTLKIGTLSFGGGLAGWIYQEFVVNRAWVDEEDFAASLAISQILPGANVVNLVICLCEQLLGRVGAVVGVFGFLVGPFFAVIGMAALIDGIDDVPLMRAMSAGVAFAAVGLILVICWRGVARAARAPASLAVIAVTAIAIGVLQLPLLWTVAVVAPVSVAMAWSRA